MPRAILHQAELTALHTVVGPVLRRIDDDKEAFGGNEAQLERIKKTIGLNERRVVVPGTTALDLCREAALKLPTLEGVDALIFVTQTPDHFQPCNAALLHGQLGLPETTAAFDVALGCSGWVYGLYLASLMVESGGCERVLLCAGDTISRCVNPRDRATASLFGDGGSAALVERRSAPEPSWFVLHTKGSGAEHICVPAGGFRQPFSEETRVEIEDADGNVRSPENLYMNGAEVFNFAMLDEPKAVKEILDFAELDAAAVDCFAFHQANRYILTNVARRVKISLEKVPMESVARFGNLSSASIPGVLCDERADRLLGGPAQLLVSGFGVGLSWASAILQCGPLKHCGLSIFGEG